MTLVLTLVTSGYSSFKRPLLAAAARMHRHDLAATTQIYACCGGIGKDVGHGHTLYALGHIYSTIEMVCNGTGKGGLCKAQGKGQDACDKEILTDEHG